MKHADPHTALDAFLKSTLLSAQEKYQPFDWSEIEPLLRSQRTTVPVTVNKKALITTAGILGSVVVVILLVLLVRNNFSSSNAPSENELPAETLVPVTDTAPPIVSTTVVAMPDSARIDSAAYLAGEKRKADSLARTAAADSAARAKVVTPVVAPVKTKDKKKKNDTAISTPVKDTVVPVPVADTVPKYFPSENIVQPTVKPDTGTKTSNSPKDSGKKKRSKTKKGAANPDVPPAAAPPDSLKQ